MNDKKVMLRFKESGYQISPYTPQSRTMSIGRGYRLYEGMYIIDRDKSRIYFSYSIIPNLESLGSSEPFPMLLDVTDEFTIEEIETPIFHGITKSDLKELVAIVFANQDGYKVTEFGIESAGDYITGMVLKMVRAENDEKKIFLYDDGSMMIRGGCNNSVQPIPNQLAAYRFLLSKWID